MNRKTYWLLAFFGLFAANLSSGQSKQFTVSGTVTSAETGESLPGVSVAYQGTGIATSTGEDGRYSLQVPDQEGILVFTYVGFKTIEESIRDRPEVNIVMEADVSALEEVVVVGYGTQQRRDLTGSISSVSAADIQNQPLVSIDQLLQGKAPGIQISNASGAPGGRVNIRIRGGSSVNAGNEPLFVIDGVPVYSSNKDPGGTSYGTFTPTNALASLNPNDIESVEILKDASATAIYGSRGANGVILITTKRGRGEQISVNYDGYYGVQSLVRKVDLMNGQEHAAFLNDWATEGGLPRPFEDPAAIGEGTDWQDELFRTAPVQNHQVSLSSGRGNTRYFISGNYYNQEGIALNSGLERFSFRVNTDSKISDRLRFSQSLIYNRTLNQSVPSSSAGSGNIRSVADKIFATSPTIPVFDENGEYVTDWYGAGKAENPVAALQTVRNQLTGDQLLGNLSLEYDLPGGLTLKTLLGVNLMNRSNEEYYPRETTYIGGILGGLGMVANRRITNILNENTLRYTKTFNQVHDLEVLGGFTWQTERNKHASTQPSGFPHDRFGVDNIAGASGVPEVGSSVNEWNLASLLGRINYQYHEKYLITATFRADGSSKFGQGNKWGYFPSVALGWRLSEEPFVKNLQVFDDLKVRASYGLTGNQEIGNYQSLARVVTSDIYIFDGELVSGASQTSLANTGLRWEKASQWDIGLDMSLFRNRIRLVFDYYEKNTNDLLFTINLPAYSGYSSALYNTGELENKGFEIGMDGDILQGPFGWNLQANYSRNRSQMASLGRSASTSLFVGHPPNVARGYVYDGVFHNQAEIDAQSVQVGVQPGDARYRDVNGDGQLDADDRVILGDPLPESILGITNHFSYQGFTLSVFLQGEIGMDEMNSISSFDPASGGSNKIRTLLHRWTSDHPSSDIPRANVGNWLSNSTYSLTDLSYVKIRNIQLGYDFPANTIPGFRRAHIYLSGQNLFTFTDYPGFDPDGGRHYPTARTIILGVNIGL